MSLYVRHFGAHAIGDFIHLLAANACPARQRNRANSKHADSHQCHSDLRRQKRRIPDCTANRRRDSSDCADASHHRANHHYLSRSTSHGAQTKAVSGSGGLQKCLKISVAPRAKRAFLPYDSTSIERSAKPRDKTIPFFVCKLSVELDGSPNAEWKSKKCSDGIRN